MRWIGLDVHVDFCEVAIHREGTTRRAARVETSEQALRRFGEQLVGSDTVVLEATGGAWSIARLLSEYAQVLVADGRPLRALSQAKAKTDRADARSLAETGADQPRHVRLHQLLHDPGKRLAQEIEARTLKQVADDLLGRHPLPLGHRGDSPLVSPWQEPTSLSAAVAGLRSGSVRRAPKPRYGT